ncbi:MAG: VCBS repeat-containing protein [Verrucomicrobiota bacterium]
MKLGLLILSLLALGADAAERARVVELPVFNGNKAGFTQIDPTVAGFVAGGTPGWQKDLPTTWAVNSGLAAGDVDGDGLCDLFLCGMDGPNVLYRNLGDWKFQDITANAGVACAGRFLTGATFADVDGDGDLDLIVLSMDSPNGLFLNDGKGHFTEKTDMPWRKLNISRDISPALADVDGDGDLDLYVTSYLRMRLKETMLPAFYREMVNTELKKVRDGLKPSKEFQEYFTVITNYNNGNPYLDVLQKGVPDVLYLNDGKGSFKPITDADRRFQDEDGRPIPMPADWGLAATFRDVDGDGDPDLYVCNDYQTPDRFWINDGTGRFRLISRTALRRMCYFSMGVDFADINRDGHLDFFTVDMLSREHTRRKTQMGDMQPTPVTIGEIDNRPQVMQNTLFLNRGDGTFAEIAQFAGIKASEWSWSVSFLDADLDGYEDLLVTTGMIRDFMDSDANAEIAKMGPLTPELARKTAKMFPTLATPNFIFRNKGNLQFEDVSGQWGFRTAAVSGGMALADLDNDGDLDVVINNTGSAPELYRNESNAPRVAVRLKGNAPNTQGIGAKLKLVGGPVEQTTEVIAGGVYASGSDPLRVFAAGKGPMRLEVTWRNGKKSVVEDVKANRLYVIDESGSEATKPTPPHLPEPYYVDESYKLRHRHGERAFDDFVRQSLLPNRLSQLGPGVAWVDADGDGDEDLVIGSGNGGKLTLLKNDGRGGFQGYETPALTSDTTGLVAWPQGSKTARLLVGISNFEEPMGALSSVQAFGLGASWAVGETVPLAEPMVGPMSLGDVDGDGDLDLFVGGRTVPGKYPEPAGSRLYRNDNGKWQLAQEWPQLGLASGSVLGDLEGDGDMDLVLACEWGPVRVFRNDRGQFTEATRELGLSGYTGWWNGVTLGDIDGDGRLDIVASNWGRNSKYEHAYSVLEPLKIYYGDFDGNGSMDIVEAHYDKRMGKLVPERGLSCSSRAMPFIRERTPTYLAFGSCGLEEIYGDKLKGARVVEANTLEHMVFLNRGKSFQAQPLPVQAQLAPGFGVNVGDYDGDGVEDVFLSQNFFAVQIETPRNDGGRGLWLRGDGKGNLVAVPGQESGIKVYGEQRGSALCDFDGDGRVDVVVSQNGAETKLYRNVGGKPGIRVRLAGGAENPGGIGAVMRLEYADGKKGPTRAILAGSGYWSQDSAVQVLGQAGEPESLWVRWPGGKETRTSIPANAKQITVNAEGAALAAN